MPEVSDVVKALAGVDQLISVARAGLWGAAQATAPKDRWQNADDHLVAAIRAIENARALLAAVDKQEAYCTTCGVPLLNQTAGWKHWNGSGSYDAGHPADMDWRPLDRPVPAVYGPHCPHDDCPFVGPCGETGLIEYCCRFSGCPECGGLRNGPEDWGSDPARLAAMTPDVQDRVRAYWARYPLVRRGPDDTAERAARDLADHDDEDDDPWWCEGCPSPTTCAPAGRCAERRPRQAKEN